MSQIAVSALARTFHFILANRASTSIERTSGSDTSFDSPVGPVRPIRADLAAAAFLLAKTLLSADGLMARLAADDGVISLIVTDTHLAGCVAQVVERCVFQKFCDARDMTKSADIRRIAHARGIDHLYHFSPAGDLDRIVEHGLRSRASLDAAAIPYLITDRARWDGRLDALSLSIESLNRTMFAAKQAELATEWLIYELDASVHWTHECCFCWTNAASAEISTHRAYLGGRRGFSEMFVDRETREAPSLRRHLGRRDCEPTYNDAEVQVLQPISFDLVTAIYVRSTHSGEQVDGLAKAMGAERTVIVAPQLFL